MRLFICEVDYLYILSLHYDLSIPMHFMADTHPGGPYESHITHLTIDWIVSPYYMHTVLYAHSHRRRESFRVEVDFEKSKFMWVF